MPTKREVVMSRSMYQTFQDHLLQNPDLEQLGYLLAGVNQAGDTLRLLAREFIPVPLDALSRQTGTYIEPSQDFVKRVLGECRDRHLSLLEAHSHPFARDLVTFSSIDQASEWEKFPYVASKLPEIRHATLVLGQGSIDGHLWSQEDEFILPMTGLRIVCTPVEEMSMTSWQPVRQALARNPASREAGRSQEVFSRQSIAFGEDTQERLARTLVGVVGVSGIGSHVVQQLAYLGIRNFILVDPQEVEAVNLNRLVGASLPDVGRPKVAVLGERIRAIGPRAQVVCVQKSVADPSSLAELKRADVLIGCTDTEHSRSCLNSLVTQYLIPYLDCGTGIDLDPHTHRIAAMGGQVRLVLPDFPCLECVGGIDKKRAREEVLTPEDRAAREAHGYGLGAEEPAPAVVYLNGAVASMAVGEVFNLIAGYRDPHPYLFYNHLTGETRVLKGAKREDCIACGRDSTAGLGDIEPLLS